jgi:hypothetical protein
MSARGQALWARLRATGIASGDAPADDDTPWYLAALAGASAWIAALLLGGFFFTLFDDLWKTPALAFALGAGCCVFALLVLRHLRGREFFEQFAIAASLAGQFLIGIAFEKWSRQDAGAVVLGTGKPDWHLVWAGIGVVALVLYVLARQRMHRFLCGLIVAGALVGVMVGESEDRLRFSVPLLAWAMLVLWWRSTTPDRCAPALPPLAWATSLMAVVFVWFIGPDTGGPGAAGAVDAASTRLAQALVVPLLPVCTYWLWTRCAATVPADRRLLVLATAVVFGLLWWRAPGVAVCACVTLIGFALYRPALLGVGVAGLGIYLVRYYYQLDVPLLEKSYWLVAGGAVLLAARSALPLLQRGEAE